MNLRCAQKGCTFEAEETPENCPVCNNPFIDNDVDEELTWSDYTVDELREQLTEWDVEGWNSRTAKPDLIELLEAAEAEREIDYDAFDIDAIRELATERDLEGWDDDTSKVDLIELLEVYDLEHADDDNGAD